MKRFLPDRGIVTKPQTTVFEAELVSRNPVLPVLASLGKGMEPPLPATKCVGRQMWEGHRVPRLSESLLECGRGTVCRDCPSPLLNVGGAPCAATPSVASLWTEGWQGQGNEQGDSRGPRLSESLPECGRGTVCRDCSSTFLSVGGAPCAATPSRASLWREGWQGQGNEQGDSRVPRLSESLPECGRGTVCRDSSSP